MLPVQPSKLPKHQTARITNVTFLNCHKLQKLKIISILWEKCSFFLILVDGAAVNESMVHLSQTGSQIINFWL